MSKRNFYLILLLFNFSIYAQVEDVEISHPVYNFLSRMYSLGLVQNYDDFYMPSSRSIICAKLMDVDKLKERLNGTDLEILRKYLYEFTDWQFQNKQVQGLFNNTYYRFNDTASRNFYFYRDSSIGSLYINLMGEADYASDFKTNVIPAKLGGIIRGTLYNHLGFYLYGTNGKLLGSKQTAYLDKNVSTNFKLNENPDESFFDDTRGHIKAMYNSIYIKIGRDDQQMGYGRFPKLVSTEYPRFDALSFGFEINRFRYDFFHGKLLANAKYSFDSVSGSINSIPDKFIAWHRLQFTFGSSTKFGIGEFIVYGNRSMDISYINPLVFYKSIEHSNRDRDNAMLFFDISTTAIPGIRPYLIFLLDDIDYSKVGKGWYGNQTALNAGVSVYSLNKYLPIDFNLDFLQIQPYVFSHRIELNNFSNFGYLLGFPLQPNSRMFSISIDYRFSGSVAASISGFYAVHGKNIVDQDGNIVKNVGGDFIVGYRVGDSERVFLLDGQREYLHRLVFGLNWQPVYGIDVNASYIYGDLNFTDKANEKKRILKLSLITKF